MPTVMIAEDELLIADMIAEVLAESGYDVSGVARSVAEAIELGCLLYTSPSPRDLSTSRMPSSA